MARTRLSTRTVAVAVVAVATLGLWSPAATSRAAAGSTTSVGRRTERLSPRLAALARPSVQRSGRATQARATGLPASGAGSLLRRPDGEILVRLRLTDLSTTTRSAVLATGATFVADGHDNATATVAIAPGGLSRLAALPTLQWAQEELTPRVNDGARLARFAGRTAAAAQPLSTRAAVCPSGVVSEGDTQLNVAQARAASHVNGAGVKVGILSDSYNSLGGAATDVANGELPGPANPCGFHRAVQNLGDHAGADEGRAMAQIVHDLAPGAALAFRTAFNGEQDFADGIRALRDAGATVIVDDVSYYEEPMFQDGVIAAAIDDVESTGVSYFSSAANTNLVVGGQDVGSYEAPAYRPIPCPVKVANEGEKDCHDFDPGAGTSSTDQLTVPGDADLGENQVRVALGWSEPQFGITTDFDLYLLNSSGAIVANTIANNIQSGEASEILNYPNTTGSTQNYRLVIARYQKVLRCLASRSCSTDLRRSRPCSGTRPPAPTSSARRPMATTHRCRARRWRRPRTTNPTESNPSLHEGRRSTAGRRCAARHRLPRCLRARRSRSTSPPPTASRPRSSQAACEGFQLLWHLGRRAACRSDRRAAASTPALSNAHPDPRRAALVGSSGRYLSRRRRGLGPDRRYDGGVGPRPMSPGRAGRAAHHPTDEFLAHDLLDRAGVARLAHLVVPDHDLCRALLDGERHRQHRHHGHQPDHDRARGRNAVSVPGRRHQRGRHRWGIRLLDFRIAAVRLAVGVHHPAVPGLRRTSADQRGAPRGEHRADQRERDNPGHADRRRDGIPVLGPAGRPDHPAVLRILPACARPVRAHLLVDP